MMLQSLEIEHLKLVAGWSMGCCQAFQWATQYHHDGCRRPHVLLGAHGSFNQVFLVALRRAIETDPTFAKGFYTVPPIAGLKTFAAHLCRVGLLRTLLSDGGLSRFRGEECTSSSSIFLGAGFHPSRRLTNLLALLWTWMNGDVATRPLWRRLRKALGSIKAKTIILRRSNGQLLPARRQP